MLPKWLWMSRRIKQTCCIHQCGLGGGWFGWAYCPCVCLSRRLSLEQDYAPWGDRPPECWHSVTVKDRRKQHGHQNYCFNRLLPHYMEQLSAWCVCWSAPATVGWRNRWCTKADLQGCTGKKVMLSPHAGITRKSLFLVLIDKTVVCSCWRPCQLHSHLPGWWIYYFSQRFDLKFTLIVCVCVCVMTCKISGRSKQKNWSNI